MTPINIATINFGKCIVGYNDQIAPVITEWVILPLVTVRRFGGYGVISCTDRYVISTYRSYCFAGDAKLHRLTSSTSTED